MRLVTAVLCGCSAGGAEPAGGVVCRAPKAVVESAGLVVRSGVDGALYDDGRGGMAGMAAWRLCSAGPAAGGVFRTARAECFVDTTIFRAALAAGGIRGNSPAVVGHRVDHRDLQPGAARRRLAAGAISGVGGFCSGAE